MKRAKEALTLLAGLVIITLFLFISGIGCPIRFVTGISCPGCGITRALWAALHFRFGAALYYHPLFWVLPLLIVMFFLREHIPRKGQNVLLCLLTAAYLAVYFIRLADPGCFIVTADPSSGCFAVVFRAIAQQL